MSGVALTFTTLSTSTAEFPAASESLDALRTLFPTPGYQQMRFALVPILVGRWRKNKVTKRHRKLQNLQRLPTSTL